MEDGREVLQDHFGRGSGVAPLSHEIKETEGVETLQRKKKGGGFLSKIQSG